MGSIPAFPTILRRFIMLLPLILAVVVTFWITVILANITLLSMIAGTPYGLFHLLADGWFYIMVVLSFSAIAGLVSTYLL